MPQGLNITLTTSATLIAGNGIHGVLRVRLRNPGTGTAYLGGSDATTAGFAFTTGENPFEVTLLTGEALYGTSTGACVLSVLRYNETT